MPITNLKIHLLEKGVSQRTIAHRTGIPESIFSMIANGRYLPDSNQRLLIATVLNAEPEQLFDQYQVAKEIG